MNSQVVVCLLLLIVLVHAENEVCGIMCFFNPFHLASRTANYYHAREWSRRQGLRLVVVELVYNLHSPFEINGDDELTTVIRRRCPTVDQHLMWQKEALLNIALDHLPPQCTKVVWLDSDVILEDGWLLAISTMLDNKVVGQCFHKLVRLPRGVYSPFSYWSEVRSKRLGLGFAEGQMQTSSAFQSPGHTGFCWAIRRSAIEATRFYDRFIVGGFDTMSFRVATTRLPTCEARLNPQLQGDFDQWAMQVRRQWGPHTVGVPVGMEVRAATFWHGQIHCRNYTSRHRLLMGDFDPQIDVEVNPDGILQWTSHASPELKAAVKEWFVHRQEDG